MSVRFNAPPGWPAPSPSWAPDDDWMPDPSWPAPPRGWDFWIVADRRVDPPSTDIGTSAATPRFGTPPRTTAGTYGTDRGSWLEGLRVRAAADESVEASAEESAGESAEESAVQTAVESADANPTADVETPRERDGVLTSAGRLDI